MVKELLKVQGGTAKKRQQVSHHKSRSENKKKEDEFARKEQELDLEFQKVTHIRKYDGFLVSGTAQDKRQIF